MTVEGVDYSYGRPGGQALAAAGKRFAIRYITGAGKALTSSEVDDLHAYHLAIGLVFESTSQRALAGHGAGVADAANALSAMTKLGVPADVACYFAVDFNATPAQQPAIDAYLRGAATVLGDRVGVYGGYGVVKRCSQSHSAAWFWQTYAWSAGKIAVEAHLHQYNNGELVGGSLVDLCRALKDPWGQWTGGSQSGPNQPGGDMAINTEGIILPSSHAIALPDNTPIYDAPAGGAKVLMRTAANAAPVPYFGIPDGAAGWHAVRVDLPGVEGTRIAYTNSAAQPYPLPIVAPPAPDCTAAIATATKPLEDQIAVLEGQVAGARERQHEADIKAVQDAPTT